MLLHMEWEWIEETADSTLPWDQDRHCLAENVGDNSQEDHRDIDGLWLEVEDFLEYRAEA